MINVHRRRGESTARLIFRVIRGSFLLSLICAGILLTILSVTAISWVASGTLAGLLALTGINWTVVGVVGFLIYSYISERY
ncbi:hypothetical protein [Halocatena marina]|uniref:Uncharacterized protein n=1 Tax=Halocatena marina TaxID=2934937 RepID=A0ABD5YY83_9EURY|nr:hypothetical protein [Halocatena marina]